MSQSPEESIYLNGELYERISLAEEAYRKADAHRYDGDAGLFGHEGAQFCSMLVEYLDEMRDEGWDELARFDLASELYETAWEHYPRFAPLLDADEIAG